MSNKDKKKVILAFDGGIDSAVAASILKVQGYDVAAVHLRIWAQDDERDEFPDVQFNCAGINIEKQLKEIASSIKIPLHIIPVSEVFKGDLIEKYVHTKLEGQHFDVCKYCMHNIIIKELIGQIEYFGAESVATGHFARITYNQHENRYSIWRSKNLELDSSRFLFGLTQEELSKVSFPIGDLHHDEIDVLAERFHLSKIVRPRCIDKNPPCFLQLKPPEHFIKERSDPDFLKAQKGNIIDRKGEILKEHDGYYKFTVGEKSIYKVRGRQNKFVLSINVRDRNITVGPKEDLQTEEILLHRVNLINIPKIKTKDEFLATTMPGDFKKCTIHAAQDKKIILKFLKPEYGFWIGKEVAIYDKDLLLGGGIIEAML